LLSLERTQVPSFASGVFGSYDYLVEFVSCHPALSLAFLSLVS
jgi:hypothetical protein